MTDPPHLGNGRKHPHLHVLSESTSLVCDFICTLRNLNGSISSRRAQGQEAAALSSPTPLHSSHALGRSQGVDESTPHDTPATKNAPERGGSPIPAHQTRRQATTTHRSQLQATPLLHADHGKELLQEPVNPALSAGGLALGAQRDELGESRGEIFEEQLLVCRVLLHDLAEIWGEARERWAYK